MKKFFAIVAMLLFATPLLAQDQNAPADTTAAAPVKAMKKAKAPKASGDEAGIKKTFAEVSDAWNAGDAKGVASHFTTDSSLINPMGVEGKGRDGVLKVVEAEFEGPMKGTQQTFDDFSVRFYPMPNIALVDCTATVTGMKKPDGTDADPAKFHLFAIVVNRTGKKWEALLVRPYAFLQPPSDASAAPADAADASMTPVTDKAAPGKSTDSKSDMNK